jgi:hypothetical protein
VKSFSLAFSFCLFAAKPLLNQKQTQNDKKNNKSYFPKYFEKNPTSIPQSINELKDDIYPLITDKIVEYFMDQVIATMDKDTKDKCLIIYIKDDKNTYNNIRYVIMHILNFIEMPRKKLPEIVDVNREVTEDEAIESKIEQTNLEIARTDIQLEKIYAQLNKISSEKELEEETQNLIEQKN